MLYKCWVSTEEVEEHDHTRVLARRSEADGDPEVDEEPHPGNLPDPAPKPKPKPSPANKAGKKPEQRAKSAARLHLWAGLKGPPQQNKNWLGYTGKRRTTMATTYPQGSVDFFEQGVY